MTIRLIEDTANTAPLAAETSVALDSSTAPPLVRTVLGSGGRFMASVVLAAALSVGGTTQAQVLTSDFATRRRYGVEQTETGVTGTDHALVEAVTELFEEASSEFFEDGVHGRFSRRLLALLAGDASAVVRAIAAYLFSGQANATVASESLRWLAEFEDPTTLTQRWEILRRSLTAESSRVRDGAILGFASLDDARALPMLLAAQNNEPVAELRRLIDQVVAQLNARQDGYSAANGKAESLV